MLPSDSKARDSSAPGVKTPLFMQQEAHGVSKGIFILIYAAPVLVIGTKRGLLRSKPTFCNYKSAFKAHDVRKGCTTLLV